MKHTTTLVMLVFAVSLTTTLTKTRADEINDAAVALVMGNSQHGAQPVQVISENGQNAFVHSQGDGSGVIFGPKGSTLVQKIGDTTFITPTYNTRPCDNRER